jgi:hypothetical protein
MDFQVAVEAAVRAVVRVPTVLEAPLLAPVVAVVVEFYQVLVVQEGCLPLRVGPASMVKMADPRAIPGMVQLDLPLM